MLGRFTFNPIYVIGNKLALILLIGPSFLVHLPRWPRARDRHINNLSLWLLEPVDRPGVKPGPRSRHSLQDLVGDLLEESVSPTVIE